MFQSYRVPLDVPYRNTDKTGNKSNEDFETAYRTKLEDEGMNPKAASPGITHDDPDCTIFSVSVDGQGKDGNEATHDAQRRAWNILTELLSNEFSHIDRCD